MTSVELRQDRAKLVADAGAILAAIDKDGRKIMTAEEAERFQKLHDDADALLKQIERIELQEKRQKEMVESRLADRDAGLGGGPSRDVKENAKLEMEAFRSFLRGGPGALTDEQRAHYSKQVSHLREVLADLPQELRAAQTVTTTGGGYLIPREFQAELDKAMLAFGPMLNEGAVRIVRTPTGAPLDWPTVSDVANKGRLLAINTGATQTGFAVGQVAFGAYKFSSDYVLVPVELAQDSAFDVDVLVRDLLAERIGRIVNDYLTTGTGSAQPKGIVVTAADSTFTFDISDIAAIATAYTWYTSLVNLEHSIDPAYRGTSAFMFHDTILRDLKKVRDTTGQPIWQPGMTAGAPDRIMGYPYWINQSMADSGTATNKAVLFGDLKKYVVRMVRPTVMLRLVERFAELHQVAFLGFERLDGNSIDASTTAIKYAAMAA